MDAFLFTRLTKIEIRADRALVTRSYNRRGFTSVADNIRVSGLGLS